MRNLLFILSIFLFFVQFPLSGQINIQASKQTGCDSLTVEFSISNLPEGSTVKWYFGDGLTINSNDSTIQHKYLSPGNYTVSLVVNSDSIGKVDFIKVGKTPKAEFNFHDTLDIGSKAIAFNPIRQDNSPFPYIFSWVISDGKVGNTANYMHKFDTTGIYTAKLTVSDMLGCASSVVKKVEVSSQLNVPNVFTPNDDNFNDQFIVQGNGENTYFLQVFSRTGIKVFETAAKVLVWDGRMFSGEKSRDGIYYYTIEALDGPRLQQSGFFYIYGSHAN